MRFSIGQCASFCGVLMVAASTALAVNVTRNCQGSGLCTGTASCSSIVAWCCCKPLAGGAYTCSCATGADCKKDAPAGSSCEEAS